jgi:hypothetical protein
VAKNNLENELRNLKFIHLTESEIEDYCDKELDPMRRARVEAHVKECFRCERQLAVLLAESAALDTRATTAADVAIVERLMDQMGLAPKPSASDPVNPTKEIPLAERLAEYLRQMVASWRLSFGQGVLRGEADQDEVVWRWQSEDGRAQAHAIMEKNADLAIHFSSNEMTLEGARLHFRLGSMNQELMLRRISESEVTAQVAVPWQYRQGRNLTDISIEIV